MESQKLTEYERKRLENMKRNSEMVAALKLHSKAATLSATVNKRQKTKGTTLKKKPKSEVPIVIRRSLRARGMSFPSESKDLADNSLKPISMIDAYRGAELDYNQVLIKTILDDNFSEKGTLGSCKNEVKEEKTKEEFEGVVKNENIDGLELKIENEAYIMPGRITVVKFFPCGNTRMIAAGNIHGNIAFWNVDCEDEHDDGIYIYRPHTGSISGILIQQYSMSKIYSSCNDGNIRLMDAEKEVFDLVYSCDETIYYLSQQPNDSASLYFSEGLGGLNVWDIRTGKSRNWMLHKDGINTISFNLQNPNVMATSSTDGTACIWDLRRMSYHKPKTLKTVSHSKVVNSAYFSPSGTSLATTSLDNNVGIISGVNFEDTTMIYHDNSTGSLLISFRGIWGWDDSCIFVGNMKKGIDVISPVQRRTVKTLQSPKDSPIPYRFDSHPFDVGMLAAATNGGGIYLWSTEKI